MGVGRSGRCSGGEFEPGRRVITGAADEHRGRNTMTPRQYDLFLTRTQKLAVGLPLIVFTVMPVLFLVVFSSGGFKEAPEADFPAFFPVFPLAIFLVFGAFYAWSVLSMPYRISVTRDRQLVFKSIVSSRSVRVSELLSIEPRSLNVQANVSGYVLKHQNGKIRFPGQFTEQYMLLYELKQANPRLDIKGC